MRPAFLAAGALALLVGLPAPARAADVNTQAPPATCPRREVLLLMDQSSSLRTTDPNAARVDAAKVLVSSLSQSGAPVHLAVAGFGDDVSPLSQFDLPDGDAAAQAAVDGFRDRNDDGNTDYVLALEAAAQHFAAIQAPQDCKTLLWFTDGAYDLDELVPAIGRYSSSTDLAAILDAFEVNVCGPGLAPASTLNAPVSEHLRAAGFLVDLVDLRTGGETGSQAVRRAATEQVLNRMFDPGDSCAVPGQRVSVGNAEELVGRFFEQAQTAAGRRAIDCDRLAAGFPIGLTRAVAVRGSTSQTSLSVGLPGAAIAPATGTIAHVFSDAERAQPGNFTVEASGGSIAECFIDVEGSAALVGQPTIYEKATSTPLGVAVGGPGADVRPELNVGPEFVSLDVAVDGAAATATWDPATSRWLVDVPGPRDGTVTVAVTPRVLALDGEALTGFTNDLAVAAAPPPPQVAWVGERTIEGSGDFDRELRVPPGAATGGTVCVTFSPSEQAFASTEGDPVAHLQVGGEAHCGPDDEPFDVPATLVVEDATNAAGSATATFRSSYTPPDSTAPQDLGESSVALGELQLTKAPDVGRFWLVGLALAALSAALAYACLYLFTRRQTRLPDPTGFLMARVPLVDAPRGRLQPEPGELRMSAMRTIRGTHSQYRLGPDLVVDRHTSANVLAPLDARVSARSGKVLAFPSLGQTRRGGRTVSIPSRFRELVLVHLPADGLGPEAVVVVPAGTTPQALGQTLGRALDRLGSAIATARAETLPTPEPTRPAAEPAPVVTPAASTPPPRTAPSPPARTAPSPPARTAPSPPARTAPPSPRRTPPPAPPRRR